ncbi:hypothetical protein HZA75_04790 [Candidatus Roizmanbacteria bacterium]|nr:hypothetical protein [Candidatus Roizmanbacteria bacterium]
MHFPFFSKKEQKEFYLGIFLKEDQGVLMTFLKENGRLELVDREKFTYTNGWENLTDDVDEALYKLEKNLEVEIKKTIVFVYSHLMDEKIGDIKPVYLQKIKQLVKALELQAMGYVECFEAISFYLEKNEQISLTAILIEIDKTQLGIFVYKGGKIDSKKILARTDDIISDLSEGFEEIKKKTILPARIILYDSGNLDDTATKILSHRWSSDYFVQIPKVDILSEDEVINGLMGIFGEQIKNQIQVKREDNKEREKRETLGFFLNEDVGEKPIVEENRPRDHRPLAEKSQPWVSWKNKLIAFLPKKNSTNFSGKIFPIIGALIIIVSFFINEYFFHRAELTVYLPTQKLEKTAKIEIDYRMSSASADFSETINTTGKQEVGDKARGQVTIYNSNLSSAETLAQKTLIVSPNNLKFVLESEVKIASATGDASSSQPATAKVSVVAETIGEEYNQTANTKFTIEGKSKNLLAKNDSALSGGSKKQIQTVAKKDQENLKEIILNKAKKEIPSIKVSPNETVVSSLSRVDFNKTDFSKELGEESNKLSLKATVAATHFLYDKNSFIDKALALLKPEVKKEYQLEKENISYTINKIDKKDNQLIVNAKIKAKAVIKVSGTEIKKSVLGKNESKLKEILKSQYKIDGYNLIIKEPLPLLKNYLPFFLQNINLKNSSL